jgi:RNA polymerase sigma factor (sigma-70 family)
MQELNARRQGLVAKNLGIAGSIAQRYRGQGVDVDDLRQEAKLGLCRAALTFDFRRRVKFGSYAKFWIHKYLLAMIAESRAFPVLIDFQPDDLVGEDPAPDQDERMLTRLWDAIEGLPVDDRSILVGRFLRGWTVEETQTKCRVSAHLIRRSLDKSMNRLSDTLRIA